MPSGDVSFSIFVLFERMAGEVPGLARATVPGVGHVPSLAQPEATEAIYVFLAPV